MGPPLGHHVDDAAELEHEEAGVVRHVRLLRGEEIDRPHVQVFLPPRPRPELELGAEHLGAVQRLEVATQTHILLLLQRVLDDPDVLLRGESRLRVIVQHLAQFWVEERRPG